MMHSLTVAFVSVKRHLMWRLPSLLFCPAFLALTNSTTFEIGSTSEDDLWYLRDFRECDLPFSHGAVSNLAAFCCQRQVAGSAPKAGNNSRSEWRPTRWQLPQHIERDSEFGCSNLWENKHYSCC